MSAKASKHRREMLAKDRQLDCMEKSLTSARDHRNREEEKHKLALSKKDSAIAKTQQEVKDRQTKLDEAKQAYQKKYNSKVAALNTAQAELKSKCIKLNALEEDRKAAKAELNSCKEELHRVQHKLTGQEEELDKLRRENTGMKSALLSSKTNRRMEEDATQKAVLQATSKLDADLKELYVRLQSVERENEVLREERRLDEGGRQEVLQDRARLEDIAKQREGKISKLRHMEEEMEAKFKEIKMMESSDDGAGIEGKGAQWCMILLICYDSKTGSYLAVLALVHTDIGGGLISFR